MFHEMGNYLSSSAKGTVHVHGNSPDEVGEQYISVYCWDVNYGDNATVGIALMNDTDYIHKNGTLNLLILGNSEVETELNFTEGQAHYNVNLTPGDYFD